MSDLTQPLPLEQLTEAAYQDRVKDYTDGMKKTDKFRDWMLVCNNYSDYNQEQLRCMVDKCNYLVAGREIGDKGTPHLQVFMQLKAFSTWSALNNKMAWKGPDGKKRHWWLEPARNPEACGPYCRKGGDFFESGEFTDYRENNNANRRKNAKKANEDWHEIRDMIMNGTSLATIATKYPRIAIMFADKLINFHYRVHEPAPIDYLPGMWILGETGSGKTTYCWNQWPGKLYDCMWRNVQRGGKIWFDGYMDWQHEYVLLDDVTPTGLTWLYDAGYMACLFHEKPFRAEVKGAMMMIRPKHVVVTSNYSLTDCCVQLNDEARAMIYRRLKANCWYKKDGTEELIKDDETGRAKGVQPPAPIEMVDGDDAFRPVDLLTAPPRLERQYAVGARVLGGVKRRIFEPLDLDD